ncbi:hypothetical protein [Timonella sp. A28]|uniref:hypothetical protein n=1 Tax=Timonella sp. A28 TaxID=3442640 RepID=UPI003EBFDFA6
MLSSYLTVRGTSLTAAAVFCGVFVVHVSARLSFRIFIHVGWLALGISPFIGYLAVTASVSFALSRFLTFCALFYLALVFSSVTSPTSVFNAVSIVLRRWLGPRRALHVALACALLLRLLPQVNEALRISREAARSRGLHTRGWNAFVPSALRSVQQAIHVGEAVDARGLLSYDNTHR